MGVPETASGIAPWQDEPFGVGDLVKRPEHIYAESSLHRRGVVTRCYSDESDDELYEVEWREEVGQPIVPPLIAKGYFRWGLRHV